MNANPQLQTHSEGAWEQSQVPVEAAKARCQQGSPDPTNPPPPPPAKPLGHVEKEQWAPETEGLVSQLSPPAQDRARADSPHQLTEQCLLSGPEGPGAELSGVLDPWEQGGVHSPTLPQLPLPSECKAQLAKPPGPVAPVPDHRKALAGFVVTQGCSHNAHILMPSTCQSLH